MLQFLKTILLLLLLLQATSNSYAQSYWSKLYNFCPDTFKASNNVTQYADDTLFVAAGHTFTPGISTYHCYIASFDYNGNILHKRYLYSPGKYNMLVSGYDVNSQTLIKTGENKYLLVGVEQDVTINNKINVYQPFFYFFDKNCDSLRQVKYTDTVVSHMPWNIMQDKQKNILVAGYITSSTLSFDTWSSSYYYDSVYLWVAKYDSNARQLWSRKYFGHQSEGSIFKIILAHDSMSYIITGDRYYAPKSDFVNFIAKLDTAGNILWEKPLQKPFKSYDYVDIVALKKGNYGFVSCVSDTLPSGGTPWGSLIYYGQFDENGDTLWTKQFKKMPSTTQGMYIAEAANGDLIMFADVYYDSRDHSTIIRTLSDGQIKWYREYTHIDSSIYVYHSTSAMSLTPNEQVLLSGYFTCSQPIPGKFDSVGKWSWFVLTDTFGCLTPGCQSIDTMWHTGVPAVVNNAGIEILVYPNPVQQTLFIQTKAIDKPLQVYLTDINGRRLYNKLLFSNSKQTIDMQELPPGLYMLEIWQEGRRVGIYKIAH